MENVAKLRGCQIIVAHSFPEGAGFSRSIFLTAEKPCLSITSMRYAMPWRKRADATRSSSTHVEYCYINPMKHDLVARVRDWPYSPFHRDVRAGIIPEDWAGGVHAIGEFGEKE